MIELCSVTMEEKDRSRAMGDLKAPFIKLKKKNPSAVPCKQSQTHSVTSVSYSNVPGAAIDLVFVCFCPFLSPPFSCLDTGTPKSFDASDLKLAGAAAISQTLSHGSLSTLEAPATFAALLDRY